MDTKESSIYFPVIRPNEVAQLFTEHDISIYGSFPIGSDVHDGSNMFEGYINRKHATFKVLTSSIGLNWLNNEVNFINTGKRRGIEFLPEIYLFTSTEHEHLLAKEFIPGNTLPNFYNIDYKKCEQDISKQIMLLYDKGLSANDIREHNIIYNPTNNNFTLFDYDHGTIHNRADPELTERVAIELKSLKIICALPKEPNEYISEKLKITPEAAQNYLENAWGKGIF